MVNVVLHLFPSEPGWLINKNRIRNLTFKGPTGYKVKFLHQEFLLVCQLGVFPVTFGCYCWCSFCILIYSNV